MKKYLASALGLALLATSAAAQQQAEEKVVTIQQTEQKPVAQKPAEQKPVAGGQPKPQAPQAQAPPGDARIKTALDRMKLKYSLDARGVYRVVFNIGERSQKVFLQSRTERFLETDVRVVSSTAYRVEGALPAEEAAALLTDNGQRKLGAWRILSQGGSTYVIYAVQVPADANDTLLRAAIAAAMQTADEMEKQETGKDEF